MNYTFITIICLGLLVVQIALESIAHAIADRKEPWSAEQVSYHVWLSLRLIFGSTALFMLVSGLAG